MDNEFEYVVCTTCGVLRMRKFLKYMERGSWKRSVYVCEDGKQWNGRECPDCKYGLEDKVAAPVKRAEYEEIQCTACDEPKLRKLLKHIPNGNQNRAVNVNEEGKQWEGRHCPDCKTKRNKERRTK